MLPNRLLIRAYARRSAWIWLGLRGLTTVTLAVADLPPFVPRSGEAVFFMVITTTLLCVADVRVRHERVLLGNLGVSSVTIAAISVLPPVLGELALGAVARLY